MFGEKDKDAVNKSHTFGEWQSKVFEEENGNSNLNKGKICKKKNLSRGGSTVVECFFSRVLLKLSFGKSQGREWSGVDGHNMLCVVLMTPEYQM